MTASLLNIVNVSVAYGGAPAVDRVSFEIAESERVALLGSNGAGKSSLLRAIVGLVPASGRIELGGIDLQPKPAAARVRAGIGYVPEGRRVFAGMSVRDNLEAAIMASARERARRIDAAYALFPQLKTRDRDAAWQLSGGQQQMLAISRALVQRPRLLLLDEPSLGLAPTLARDVFAALGEIAAQGTALLLAEQNFRLAATLADRAVLLDRGRLLGTLSGQQLRNDPSFAARGNPIHDPDRSSP